MSSVSSTSSPGSDRDEADHTYAESESESEPEPEPSAHDTTPSKRLQKQAISAAAKRRVDAVTVNTENRCLVTNCLPEHAVDYAHVLPRSAKDGLLTKLEFSWGMRHKTLNVDTRLNILRLRKDVHSLFDKGGFILLPEGDVLEKYKDGGKPDFHGDRTNNIRYNYTLIASTKTDGYPLHRLPFPAPPGESQEAVNFSFPFSSFPVLQSHVHPCFVICHIGQFLKQQDSYAPRISNSPDLVLRFTRVFAIYQLWKDARPDATFSENPRLPTDRDDRTGDDETHSNRVDDASNRRSARLQNKNNRQGSPLEGRGGKRQRSNNERDRHGDTRHEDSQGLRALKAENCHPHTYKRKREFVRDWVSSVVGQTFVEDDTLVSQKSQTFDEKGVIVVEELHHTPPDISVN